jgi:hypothetical protein
MGCDIRERKGWLEERLRKVEDDFERQMRARGFEPAQVELIALPGPLAKLYAEREELRADLEELKANPLDKEIGRSKANERDREN